MKIAVTGSSGFIGTALVSAFRADGHDVYRLVRVPPADDHDIQWDPTAETLDASTLEGFDVVVNLAGEGISTGKWTEEKMQRIRNSRVNGTTLLANNLNNLEKRPSVLISASAIGYYGDRANEILIEESPVGAGYLASVCREWERAANHATKSGIRVVQMRIGIVLSREGGALAKMLPAFQLGAGGVLGSGKQYMSWITIDDLVSAFKHAIKTESLSGPVNVVAPNTVQNVDFTKALSKVLGKPAFIPVPDFVLQMALGRMAEELLLTSQRVEPKKLMHTEFQWQHPKLEEALRHVLGVPVKA
jgi:uncharacterized protein (TIGR01777 family)